MDDRPRMADGLECSDPLNLGSAEAVTIDGLLSKIERIAGVRLEREYRPEAPTGVRARCSGNSRLHETVGWSPSVPLDEGLAATYRRIADQVTAE